ncbi:MAG: hypothetical protein ABI364_09705 [Caldimonas sp.]
MHDGISCAVALRRFTAWQWAVGLVAGVALASTAAWLAGILEAREGAASIAMAVALAIVLAVGVIALAVSLARVEAGVLSCTSGHWTFRADRSAGEAQAYRLVVAVDLGSFLLLRLDAVAAGSPRARRWLPVQKAGLDDDWHALRCAVYSPPPVVGPAGVADDTPS